MSKMATPIGSVNAPRPVHYGGPVETGRGFVLHSGDYHAEDATMRVDGTEVPIDGYDVWPVLTGNGDSPRKSILINAGSNEAAIRVGNWKLVAGNWKLFQCASFQLSPTPTSTVNGTFNVTARSICSRTSAAAPPPCRAGRRVGSSTSGSPPRTRPPPRRAPAR